MISGQYVKSPVPFFVEFFEVFRRTSWDIFFPGKMALELTYFHIQEIDWNILFLEPSNFTPVISFQLLTFYLPFLFFILSFFWKFLNCFRLLLYCFCLLLYWTCQFLDTILHLDDLFPQMAILFVELLYLCTCFLFYYLNVVQHHLKLTIRNGLLAGTLVWTFRIWNRWFGGFFGRSQLALVGLYTTDIGNVFWKLPFRHLLIKGTIIIN